MDFSSNHIQSIPMEIGDCSLLKSLILTSSTSCLFLTRQRNKKKNKKRRKGKKNKSKSKKTKRKRKGGKGKRKMTKRSFFLFLPSLLSLLSLRIIFSCFFLIPAYFLVLPYLSLLTYSDEITEVGGSLSKCSSLEELQLGNNKIDNISGSLKACHLTILNLESNNFVQLSHR